MTRDARQAWAANLLSGGLLAVLYGGDVAEHLRVQEAEIYALASPPSLPFAAAVLGLLALGVGVSVSGLARGRGADFRGYRLLPILAVLALFLDLFVLNGDADRVASDERLEAQLEALALAASQGSGELRVLEDAQALQPLVKDLGRPGYLEKGRAVEGFRLQLQSDCEGPRAPDAGSPLGTLLYCVSKDGRQAWITAVALPAEAKAGAPAPFTRGGGLVAARVTPRSRLPASVPETGEPLDGGSGNGN